MNTQENILGYEKLPRLLRSFAVPSIIAMPVSYTHLHPILSAIFLTSTFSIPPSRASEKAASTTISFVILCLGTGYHASQINKLYK